MQVNAKPHCQTISRLTFTLLISISALNMAHAESAAWPAWGSFKNNLINHDGRVIDYSSETNKTTSEGQAYALFFALVANDRAMFDKLLNRTERNLTANDLSSRLPAWSWGKNDDERWGILDNNSASDADLWIAYTLGEAGRLWEDHH